MLMLKSNLYNSKSNEIQRCQVKEKIFFLVKCLDRFRYVHQYLFMFLKQLNEV